MKAPEILLWTATAFLSLSSSQGQGSVTQRHGNLEKLGGQTVTLECTFSTGYQYYYLFWYRQQRSGTMDFLFRIDNSNDEENGAGRRFSAQFRKSSKFFSLTIKELEPTDSAMYFCALWEVTYAFGNGTKLIVQPENQEPSPPSVFVVKSANAKPSDGNKLTAACLVKDFFPNNVKVNMSGEADTVYKSKEGILSSNGKYSMMQVVKVEPNEEVGCYVTQEGRSYNRTQAQSATTPAPINTTQVCESSNSTVEEPNMEKVNMLSVTVLGLRVLLAKSIAFNMLMTVKLFIF